MARSAPKASAVRKDSCACRHTAKRSHHGAPTPATWVAGHGAWGLCLPKPGMHVRHTNGCCQEVPARMKRRHACITLDECGWRHACGRHSIMLAESPSRGAPRSSVAPRTPRRSPLHSPSPSGALPPAGATRSIYICHAAEIAPGFNLRLRPIDATHAYTCALLRAARAGGREEGVLNDVAHLQCNLAERIHAHLRQHSLDATLEADQSS